MKHPTIEQNLIAEASVVIHSTIEKVWNALLDPAAVREYMFGANVKSGWNEGDSITWEGEWQGKPFKDKGTILKVEGQQLLQYSHYSPLSGVEDTPSNYHTVTIMLQQEDEGVNVALTQDKNDSEKTRDHSEKNWKMMLEGLKEYVESH
jgi:uncharacterized protein YndB with AHSA1/START domain